MMRSWSRLVATAMLVGVLVYALSPSGMLQADARFRRCQTDTDKHSEKHPNQHGEMHVKSMSYRKSGGFIGISRGCDLDFSKLSHDECSKIESLFDIKEFMSLKSSTTPGAADVFYYSIEVAATSGESRSVKFDDVTLPASLRPLVSYLDGVSKDLRPHN